MKDLLNNGQRQIAQDIYTDKLGKTAEEFEAFARTFLNPHAESALEKNDLTQAGAVNPTPKKPRRKKKNKPLEKQALENTTNHLKAPEQAVPNQSLEPKINSGPQKTLSAPTSSIIPSNNSLTFVKNQPKLSEQDAQFRAYATRILDSKGNLFNQRLKCLLNQPNKKNTIEILFNKPLDNGECLFNHLFYREAQRNVLLELICLEDYNDIFKEMTCKALCQPILKTIDSSALFWLSANDKSMKLLNLLLSENTEIAQGITAKALYPVPFKNIKEMIFTPLLSACNMARR